MAKHISKRKKVIGALVIILVLLVAVRVALPYIILHYANKTLSTMDGYRGRIEDVGLALIRGAYTIDSVYLNKIDSVSKKETPFLSASAIDLSVEWRALFKGSIVGELVFEKPIVRFTKDKVEPQDVRKDSSNFKKLLDDFMPLRINTFEVKNGRIQYIDEHSNPPVDIEMSNTHILALNLRNSYDSTALLPSTITATSTIYDGALNLNMKINPLAKQPTFDMNAELKNTNLVKLNDFFQAYSKVDVNKGSFGLYAEIATKDGKFSGYVKPLIKDLDVLGKEDRKDNILRKVWEGFAGGVAEVFQNQSKDQLATKIPFQGNVKNPDANAWYAVWEVMQNAFIRALQPSIDQEINIQTVANAKDEKKNSLQKVFGKKDDNDKKDKRVERKERREERRKKRDERKSG